MKKCKVCGDKTTSVFNIDFKAIPICEYCAMSILLQEAHWLVKKERDSNCPSQKEKIK